MNARLLSVVAAVLLVCGTLADAQPPQKITINFPTRSGASWPLFIAKEGGYYQKYGLDVDLVFAGHPGGIAMVVSGEAQMSSYNLESVMQASVRDAAFTVVGSSVNRAFFVLMSRADIASVKDLKGKTLAVSQIGDPPYNYASAYLKKFGLTARDVQWVAVGTDANGRAAALAAGRADATLLTPPAYFKLEEAGFKSLGNLADHDDIFASTTYLLKTEHGCGESQAAGAADQGARGGDQALLRRQSVRRQGLSGLRQADLRRRGAVLRRATRRPTSWNVCRTSSPGALTSVIDQQTDPRMMTLMKEFDFHKVVDNSVVSRLVKEGFFEKLFGPGIKAEQDRKARLAFK